MKRFAIFMAVMGLAWACGGGPSGPSFGELIEQGWMAFADGDYQIAADRFSDATVKNPDDPEGFTGLGWSLLKLDNLSEADVQFNSGSTKMNVTADLFAGWAFTLNALKNYAKSNREADEALSLDSNWTFPYGLPLDAADLHLLRAENFFLLGDFANSLSAVQILNPNFSADVTTSAGRAALAQEIERLRETT